MRSKHIIEIARCNKCGKIAPINEEQSNENWIVYDTKESCECGGKWSIWVDGKPLTPYVEGEQK